MGLLQRHPPVDSSPEVAERTRLNPEEVRPEVVSAAHFMTSVLAFSTSKLRSNRAK